MINAIGSGVSCGTGCAVKTDRPLTTGTLRRLFGRRNAVPTPVSHHDIAPNGAQFVVRSFHDEAGTRAYKLYIPSRYRHGHAVPLVVMLHGCRQSPDDFAAATRMNALAEEHTCLVAYPAQATLANAFRCWNWFSPDDQRRGHGEPSLIAGITDEIMRDYSIDPQRVYVAGLSAGGATAAIMGTTYPDLFAAIGVHSGLASGVASDVPSAFDAMRQPTSINRTGHVSGAKGDRRCVPTIVFHGDQDTTVHPANSDVIIARAKELTTAALTVRVQHGRVPGGYAYDRTVQQDAGGRAILKHWLVHGCGHAWSGGSPTGSYTDPRGPDAAREMLRFFLEQQRNKPHQSRKSSQ